MLLVWIPFFQVTAIATSGGRDADLLSHGSSSLAKMVLGHNDIYPESSQINLR